MKIRIALSADDFEDLVSGNVVTRRHPEITSDTQVEIVLSDVGFDVMEKAVLKAELKAEGKDADS